jgi:hypothetical protein
MEWTGARYADRPAAEVSTWIDAAPEDVWPLVSDIALMPSLSSELQSVAWREAGRTFVGRSKHDAFGEWETTSYVVECEEPRVFAWAVADPAEPSAVWKFTLAPENGGTRLAQWVQLGPGRSGLSFAIDRMPEKEQKIVFVRLREFETAMTGNLAAIKERVESR